MKASVMLEKKKEFACILAFDVPVRDPAAWVCYAAALLGACSWITCDLAGRRPPISIKSAAFVSGRSMGHCRGWLWAGDKGGRLLGTLLLLVGHFAPREGRGGRRLSGWGGTGWEEALRLGGRPWSSRSSCRTPLFLAAAACWVLWDAGCWMG